MAEGIAQSVDGLALEAESNVRIHRGGDANVGMAEEFLDHDQFDALFQEKGRRRVSEVLKPDAAEPGPAEQSVEVPGEGGSLDRGAVEPGKDVAARLPVRPRCFRVPQLAGRGAVRGSADTRWAVRSAAPNSGSWSGGPQATRVGALEGAADAGGSAGQVEVFPAQAEELALAESGVRSEFEERAQPVLAGGCEDRAGLGGGERFEVARAGCPMGSLAERAVNVDTLSEFFA